MAKLGLEWHQAFEDCKSRREGHWLPTEDRISGRDKEVYGKAAEPSYPDMVKQVLTWQSFQYARLARDQNLPKRIEFQ